MEKHYPNSILLPCFFHFSQAIWRKASKLGLRKDEKIFRDCKIMIMNIKALAFTPPDEVKERFEIMKRSFLKLGTNFQEFLTYFENTWMGKKKKFNINLWNYYPAVRFTLFLWTLNERFFKIPFSPDIKKPKLKK